MSPAPPSGRISSEAELADWRRGLFRPTSGLSASNRAELTELAQGGWQRDAVCAQADPEAWFPNVGFVAGPQVLTTCARCPVRRSCLAAALLRAELGVWAGTTEAHRRALRRMLKAGVPVGEVLDYGLAGQTAQAVQAARAAESVPLDGAA
jgi:hypothetical protein